MLKMFAKIGVITIPAFVAVHLINENKESRKYCPVLKYKKPVPKTPTNKKVI
jgi:hypothetical protein